MGGRLAARARASRLAPALAAAALLAAACASLSDAPVHVVRPGENLYRISLHYGVSVAALARANGLGDADALEIGQRLSIPGARQGPPDAALLPPVAALPPGGLDAAEYGLAFGWPLRGAVSSSFGSRGFGRHEGIDIPAPMGTVVLAAESGRVVHSEGRLGDYGLVVIVKHAGRYATVYAHNRRNLVRRGDFVEKGQPIAQVGDSGNASAPHLHFEIRREARPQNPLAYLP